LLVGRNRFSLVDTLGLVVKVLVTEANVPERDGARWLLTTLGERCPRLDVGWVDGGFSGQAFQQDILERTGIRLEVLKRAESAKGFVKLAIRWVVERTFAWLFNFRRLCKDYEYWVYTADAIIYAAMVQLMLRRLTRPPLTC
jgi:putative transposase